MGDHVPDFILRHFRPNIVARDEAEESETSEG